MKPRTFSWSLNKTWSHDVTVQQNFQRGISQTPINYSTLLLKLYAIYSQLHLSTMVKSKPIGLKWRSSTLFIVSTVGIGLFTDLFLYGLVVPILPFILQDRVNLPQGQIQSHVSGLLAAYAGASVLFSPAAGILADRLPTRQLPFLVGLTALLLATLLLFLGQNVAVLTVARILQGISAAVVWTIGLALVLDTVGPENLGKTIGSVRLPAQKILGRGCPL